MYSPDLTRRKRRPRQVILVLDKFGDYQTQTMEEHPQRREETRAKTKTRTTTTTTTRPQTTTGTQRTGTEKKKGYCGRIHAHV
jgi:hypothetical protein